MLKMQNTVIKGGNGSKSKNIKHQILVEVEVKDRKEDCVFIIVLDLICDCIIGIELLYEGGCILDFAGKTN